MSHYLDMESWSRRQLFDFFIGYANPYFNVCCEMDITGLREFAKQRETKISLALHYFALRAANETEPFRYRLQDGRVFVYDVVNGGTTVLLPNETFGYAYYDYQENFADFVRDMGAAVEAIRSGTGKLKPTTRDDVIYHTSLPWISFTSFSHARTPGRGDSVPRIVFGKFRNENGRWLMPFSVEVHHALMDGLHVGRYLGRFQGALSNPLALIA